MDGHRRWAKNRFMPAALGLAAGAKRVREVVSWQQVLPDQTLQALTEEALTPCLSTADAPEVDLLIRTGGESRVSNFLIWQAADAEQFFTGDLWPDFGPQRLREAISWFGQRDRRFGSSAPL